MIVDIHTHAFPDTLAAHAIRTLEAEADGVHACLDGTLVALLGSMDRAAIDHAVVCSIATKPRQFESILRWSGEIRSDRISPFPSVHPRDPEALDRIDRIADEGFKGIKLHPYYQDFDADEPGLLPFYRRIADAGLVLLLHTGFDIAFPLVRKADPERVMRVIHAVPGLKLVTSHFGAWKDWEAVEAHMLGRPVYMDPSYSLHVMPPGLAKRFLTQHPADRLVYGSDSPWGDQSATLAELRSMGLDGDREAAFLGGNAARLLGLG